MKSQGNRRVLALLLAGTMLSTTFSPAFALQPPAEGAVQDSLVNGFSEDPNRYEIYPVPHSVVYPEGTEPFTMTTEVNVVAETGIDTYTTAFLEEILSGYGMTMTTSNGVVEGKTNILLGIYGDGDTAVADPTPASRTDLFEDTDSTGKGKYDPYMLVADTTENANGVVTIVGKDSDCVYYGLATLQMMFTSFAGQKFLPVQIEDYSNVRFRGFIEGFYGGFDYEGRESQMRSIRDVKGNLYVFASKTDPYHAERWYDLYPDEELAQIKHLADVAKETKVDYAWSVHIGKGGFFSGASSDLASGEQYTKYLENVEKLKAKFQQMYDVGVRNFHILNDDYNSGTNADVVALLNTMNAWLKEKGDCGPILYCPKGYNVGWAGDGSELNALRGLDEDIYIYWTGSDVNSPITQDNIDWPYEKSGHYPATWLNYPCSEHDKAGIYLGDISHYVSTADGLSGQMGIISNPVNYPEANKVAYFQLISWGWNRDNYTDYMEELWEDCFKYLQPEVYDSYLTIARNVSNCPDSGRIHEGFPESEYLADTLDSVKEKALAGALTADDGELKSLLEEFAHILSAVEDFRANCANAALVAELEPWLKSLTAIVTADQQALLAILAVQEGDVNAAWTYLSNASLGLDEWDDYATPQYPTVMAKAGSRRLQPFATELIAAVRDQMLPLLSPDGSLGSGTSFYAVLGGQKQEDSDNSARMFDGDTGTAASYSIVQQEGDYVGVDLGKVQTVSAIDILQGKSDTDHDYLHKATLECSVDGQTWVTLVEKVNSHHILVEDLDVAARYVRLRLVEAGYGSKPDYWTNIREFTVTTDGAESSMVYTSLEDTSAMQASEDGGVYTLNVSGDLTLQQGDYVGLRLPEIMGISEIALTGALPEGLTLQYSANGAVWTDGAPADLAVMRYIRLYNGSASPYVGSIPAISATSAELKTELSFVSSNMSIYQDNVWEKMTDGDRATFTWTGAKQTEGQYVIFDLGSEQPVYDVTLWFPESGTDYPHYLDISVGSDTDPEGAWTSIGTFDNQPDMDPPYRYYACNGGGVSARYIKLEITKTDKGWIKFNELEVNQDLEQGAALGAFSGKPEGDFEKAMDGNITTFFAPGVVEGEDGYLQYLISDNSNLSGITILQSPDAISNAEVKVQTADQQWVSLGALDQGVCTFDTAELGALLALRLEWKAGTSPAIAEIILLTGGTGGDTPTGTIPLRTPNIYEPQATEAEAISVNYNTPVEQVGLPAQAEVTLSSGHTVTLPVTWSCDDYDPEVPGDYTFTGVYQLDGSIANPGLFALSAVVTVKEDASQPSEPEEENLALNHPVYVSGVEVANATGPELAVDGSNETRWSGNKMKVDTTSDSWIVVDLGEDVDTITSISMEYFNKVWPTDYVVQVAGSDFVPQDYSKVNVGTVSDESTFAGDNAKDAACWTTVQEFTGLSQSDNPTDTVSDITIPEGTRYVRLYFTGINSSAAGHAIGLKELTVMGTRAVQAPEETPDVTSVEALTASGLLGAAFEQLSLPRQVVAQLADGTTVRLPVEWKSAGYDPNAETQILTGTLTLAGTGVTNDNNVEAQLTLTLTGAPQVERVLLNPSSLTVELGAAFESLALPEQAVVQLSDGTAITCEILWDSTSYQPQQPGQQTVTGALVLPEGVDNAAGVTAQMTVTVKNAPNMVTVTFVSNGGTAVPAQSVEQGGTATEPPAPTRSGYRFAGWYSDEALTQAWDFSQPVNADLKLYAKWTESGSSGGGTASYAITVEGSANGTVTASRQTASKGLTVTLTVKPDQGYKLGDITVTQKSGSQVKLTDKGDGKYTFSMPASAVTVKASFVKDETPVDTGLPFADVKTGDWYYEAVKYAYDNKLMDGTSATAFAPLMTTNRAMVVTILWRQAGSPVVDYAMNFSDVEEGLWYSEAVRWAAAEGIVTGYSDTVFAPDDTVTREQLAAILYRYAGNKGYDLSAKGDLNAFTDGGKTSSWAAEAMEWAVGAKLLSGKGGSVLDPAGTATRAEVAQILMNFCQSVEQ